MKLRLLCFFKIISVIYLVNFILQISAQADQIEISEIETAGYFGLSDEIESLENYKTYDEREKAYDIGLVDDINSYDYYYTGDEVNEIIYETETSTISVFDYMIPAISYFTKGNSVKALYGKLSYIYTEDEYLNNNSINYYQQGTQVYMMGYGGSIYSPRLLDYKLEGKINYYDSKTRTGNSDLIAIKSDSQDYSIRMRIIKDSNFPFSIFLSKQNIVVKDSIYTTEQKSISGRIKFNPLSINYGVSRSSSVTVNDTKIGVSDYDNYNSSVSYRKDAHNFNFTYYHTEQTFNQKYKDYNSTIYIDNLDPNDSVVDDRLNIKYNWKISKELKFDSRGSYQSDNYSSLNSTNTNFRLAWNPNRKYGGSISADAFRYEYTDSVDDSNNIIDMFNINQNFRYKITESLVMNESASISTFSGAASKGTSSTISLNASHSYKRDIFDDAKLQVTTVASTQQLQSKTESNLEDKSDIINNSSYVFSENASIFKPLQSISSTLSLNASYSYNLQTTEILDSVSQIYRAGSSLNSTFYIFRNNLNISVFKTDSEATSYISTIINDNISTYTRLGVKGKINFKAGVKYNSYERDDGFEKSTSIDAGMGVKYRFFTKLMLNMSSSIMQQIENEYFSYSGSAMLSYAANKTSFLIKYVYNKSECQSFEENDTNKYERASLRFNIERRF